MATPERQSTPDRRVAITAIAIVALALAATVAIRWGSGAESAAAGAELDDPALGDADAPVVIVEYSDFGCPYCERHARDVKPAIIEEYVEAGVVRYEWRDFPLQGPSSRSAALAARAAQEQGLFWEFHAAVFDSGIDDLSDDRLRELAEQTGLDLDAYDDALGSAAHEATIETSEEEANDLGFSGTPSFTVNGERIMGAQSFEVFAEVIDRAAATAEG